MMDAAACSKACRWRTERNWGSYLHGLLGVLGLHRLRGRAARLQYLLNCIMPAHRKTPVKQPAKAPSQTLRQASNKTSRKAPNKASKPAGEHNITRWVLLAYALLLIYASLHPLEAMRATEADPMAFLNASRLRWAGGRPYGVGWFDALSNFVAYVPLGLGLVWALRRRMAWARAAALAVVCAAVFSLGLEALQTYHPLRVPSLWDALFNVSGAALGAGAAYALGRSGTRFAFLARASMLAPHAGAVWAVMGVWALAQLHPQSWVFVTAPLRVLWGSGALGEVELPFLNLNGAALAQLETVVASVALFCALGMLRLGSEFAQRPIWQRLVWMLAAWALLIAWQGMAYLIQYGPQASLGLWGSGVWTACWIAAASAGVLALLPSAPAAALTVAALGAYLTTVQWLPAHPYTTSSALWQYGRFTHLFGLTAAVSALWPALALAALVLQVRYFGREPQSD